MFSGDVVFGGQCMFLWLMACFSSDPCQGLECSCALGEGTILIENVEKASLSIAHSKEQKSEEIVVCSPQKDGVLCSFTPTSTLIRAEILIADKAFPLEIQSTYKTKEDCCQCGYYELTPSRIAIPYR